MTSSVLARLDAVQAEQYNMSIRLSSDGLTFALSYSSSPQATLERGTLSLEPGYASAEEAVRELLYRHPELTLPFDQVTLYYEPYFSTLVPSELYEAHQASHWLSIVGGKDWEGAPYQCLTHALSDEPKVIVSAWSEGLYQFLRRMHLQLTTIPYYVPIIERVRRYSRQHTGCDLYVLVRREGMDVVALRAGEVIYLNTFGWAMPEDRTTLVGEAIFYTFSLWRSLGLEGEADSLHLLYDEARSESYTLVSEMLEHLSPRVREVSADPFTIL